MSIVHFNEAKHQYSVGGRTLSNVTGILRDQGLYPYYPDEPMYRSRGKAVHACCELIAHGQLDIDGDSFPGTDQRLWPYLAAWLRFLADWKPTILFTELVVYCPYNNVAGMIDYVMDIPRLGGPTILDIKTGQAPDCVAIQTAGYESLLSASARAHPGKFPAFTKPVRRLSLQLKPNGMPLAEPHDSPSDATIWQSAVNMYNWRRDHKLLKLSA